MAEANLNPDHLAAGHALNKLSAAFAMVRVGVCMCVCARVCVCVCVCARARVRACVRITET